MVRTTKSTGCRYVRHDDEDMDTGVRFDRSAATRRERHAVKAATLRMVKATVAA